MPPLNSEFLRWRCWLMSGVITLLGAGCLLLRSVAGQEPATPDQTPPSSAIALPWEKTPADRVTPTFRPPANAMEILQRYDIGDSQFDGFFNGQPLERAEEDVLVKILYRFSRFGLDNLQRWRKQGVTWDQLAASPAEYRAEIFHIRGRVQSVQKQLLIPEHSSRYEFTHYYRVRIKLENSPYTALVFARKVPVAWQLDAPLDEPATVDGLFLKLGYEATDEAAEASSDSLPGQLAPPRAAGLDETRLMFAAGRVAWLPDRVQKENTVGPDQVQLAQLGVDIGLFAGVHAGNGKPIGDGDREAFYQILDALGRADPATLRRPQLSEPLDIAPLLHTDAALHGQIMPVSGIARRIVKVLVDDKDIRNRFGIDHYYEINLFLPLGKSRVLLGKDRTGEKNPVYEDKFPATLVVRRLPPGLKEGENLRELVRADAVFLKIWAYRSAYTSKYGQFQPAPMFLALEPAKYQESVAEANWVAEALVGVSMGLAVLVLIAIFWWFRRSDRNYQRSLSSTLAPASADKPDFSGL